MNKVKTGLDRLINSIDKLRNRSVALIVNETSITSDYRYIWDVLSKEGITVKRIFSPEHGIFSTEQDQIPVISQPGIPFEVVSLYGNSFDSLMPDFKYLEDVDTIIYDIQDVGSRYYTFLNTMVLFMQKVSGMDIEVIILDRPNPINGFSVEGPLLHKGFESFVGILPVSVRHGLTAGETALLASDVFNLDIECTVMEMEGWKRETYYDETGLPWIAPSPNMPELKTAIVYPGFCLLEGLNISEGRGTTMPFTMAGAPWIDPFDFASHLNIMNLGGVFFRPTYFKTGFNKYCNEVSGGVEIHVTDRNLFKPFLTGIAFTSVLFKCYNEFSFLHDVYEFNDVYPAFDLLTGSGNIRQLILEGESLESIEESYQDEEKEYMELRKKYLLYK